MHIYLRTYVCIRRRVWYDGSRWYFSAILTSLPLEELRKISLKKRTHVRTRTVCIYFLIIREKMVRFRRTSAIKRAANAPLKRSFRLLLFLFSVANNKSGWSLLWAFVKNDLFLTERTIFLSESKAGKRAFSLVGKDEKI